MRSKVKKYYRRLAMDKKKTGALLKILREKKGKKQFQVALDLSEYGIEVSDKTIAKWEKGNFPDIDKLDVLAEYYGVQPSDILNGEIYEPQNYEEQYFIAKKNWCDGRNPNELYYLRVGQESLIKRRVKELITELISSKSLSMAQNNELNFLLSHFYSISEYAFDVNEDFEDLDIYQQVKLLRHEIYRTILSMHTSSADEIFWEVKKLFEYDKRMTFERDVFNFEDDIKNFTERLQDLDDWEKDLLLAQVQTQNIKHSYGITSKLLYLEHLGKDYDEEQITKDGIRLLIGCGAKLNRKLLGYAEHHHMEFLILERMKILQYRIYDDILVSKFNDDGNGSYYWLKNNEKNRLIKLYYALNSAREEKHSLNEIYEIFKTNDSLPKQFILSRYNHMSRHNHSGKKERSEKEILLMADQLCPYEIEVWNKCKAKEAQLEKDKKELKVLEERWERGERIDVFEYDEWIGEEKNKLTEQDIISRFSQMSYEQFVAGRDEGLTKELLSNLDSMTLSEIRERYFPVEVRYE